jgi:hypothetical protein
MFCRGQGRSYNKHSTLYMGILLAFSAGLSWIAALRSQ